MTLDTVYLSIFPSELLEKSLSEITMLRTVDAVQLAEVVLQLDRVQESLVAVLDHYQPPPTTFEFIAGSLTED